MNMTAVQSLIKERKKNDKSNKIKEQIAGKRNFFPAEQKKKKEKKTKKEIEANQIKTYIDWTKLNTITFANTVFDGKFTAKIPRFETITMHNSITTGLTYNREESKLKPIHNDYKMSDIKIVNPIPERDMRYIYTKIKLKSLGLLDYVGEGCNGKVYTYKNYVIKDIRNGDDIKFLEKLQGNDLFPKLYFYIDRYMVYEKINGCTINKFKELKDKQRFSIIKNMDYMSTVINIQTKVHDAYNKGIRLSDLIYSNIMITKKGEIKVVDCGHFDKADKYCSVKRPVETLTDIIGKLFNIDYISLETNLNRV